MTATVTGDALEARLAEFARVDLGVATAPTPLHLAPRFSERIGREVWLKRDDLMVFGLGGNKVRKLEYLMGEALAQGADTLISVGATQSNHARCVAAAAARAGLDCQLVLSGRSPSRATGNLALDLLFGATVHYDGDSTWVQQLARANGLADELRARGRRPYVIPAGGSTPVGALGFVQAAHELLTQAGDVGLTPAAVVLASSTGGTQAGLEFGLCQLGSAIAVHGVGVAKTAIDLRSEVQRLVGGIADITGLPVGSTPSSIIDGYIGAGYARPTRGAVQAQQLLARTEGVAVDSVYTAKALHAVTDGAGPSGPIVFWHTGGTPSLFSDEVGITRQANDIGSPTALARARHRLDHQTPPAASISQATVDNLTPESLTEQAQIGHPLANRAVRADATPSWSLSAVTKVAADLTEAGALPMANDVPVTANMPRSLTPSPIAAPPVTSRILRYSAKATSPVALSTPRAVISR